MTERSSPQSDEPPVAPPQETPVEAQVPDSGQDGVTLKTPADQLSASLPRSQQLFVVLVMGFTLCLALVHWVRLQGWGMSKVQVIRPEEHQYDFQVDLNQSTWVEWMQLDGIGEKKAHAIVEERETNGPYSSIEDLTRVDGIGPKTLEKLRPWLKDPEEAGTDRSAGIEPANMPDRVKKKGN